MKKLIVPLILILIFSFQLSGQNPPPVTHKVAIFTPLYLDSVFTTNYAYRYANSFPKFLHAGLDFYQGAQLAIDSLQNAGAALEVFIYDSRSKRKPISQLLSSPEFANVEMIIAQGSAQEVRLLADAALKRKIPFVSATLPNDAGITANPYFVVLNSTLRAHCEGIYQYLQKYHKQDRIIVYTRNGTQETDIKNNLLNYSKATNTTPLKLEFENIGSDFTSERLTRKLDSTRRNIIIAGSLNLDFGLKLSQQLATVSNTYPITLFGMPTWEDISVFAKPEYRNMEIVYSTPFNYSRPDRLMNNITTIFTSITNGRPTDMFYRGYEVTLRFLLLLLDTKKDVAANLTRKGNYVFTNFDIQPVFLNNQSMTLDYFENKKLYFARYVNGVKSIQ